MADILHTVTVALGGRSYPIRIGSGLIRRAGKLLSASGLHGTAVIITDRTVARLYLPAVQRSLSAAGIEVRSIILPSGEKVKQQRTVESIYTRLLQWNIDRTASLIALGGGVIGDCAGFVAATYLRGIPFFQIPTTLLAQVDSSIGGKVGINHPLGKNMIGAFYQPKAVLIDTDVLSTLPKRELICGLGEVIKYGMIVDERFFRMVEKNAEKILLRDAGLLSRSIERSCRIKAAVVAQDEKEEHLRAILNFGHTVGHALELAGKFSALRHGEAVLYGLLAETFIARKMNRVSFDDLERLESLIQRIPLPSLAPLRLSAGALITAMQKDKKSQRGVIRMVLPRRIGEVTLPVEVPVRFIHSAIEYLRHYAA